MSSRRRSSPGTVAAARSRNLADEGRRGRDGWARRLPCLVSPGLCLVALWLAHGVGVAAPGNSCQQTSQRMSRSCQQRAQSDFSLASGKCANLPDGAARAACETRASANQQDALQTCTAQSAARQAVCARLGDGPYDPVVDPANFVATIDNAYLPLTPGTTFTYEAQTADGLEHEEFVVTPNTRVIMGVTCVEVRDTLRVNGELVEDTLDWFAQDKDGNVWYFGENSKQLAGGLVVSLEGSWTAGVDGAKPGIVMKAHPKVGDFYRQEFALGTAEDVAEVLSLTESVTVPYGSFANCLKTRDTSPLEPTVVEHKFYCPLVGNVLETDPASGERLELISVTTE